MTPVWFWHELRKPAARLLQRIDELGAEAFSCLRHCSYVVIEEPRKHFFKVSRKSGTLPKLLLPVPEDVPHRHLEPVRDRFQYFQRQVSGLGVQCGARTEGGACTAPPRESMPFEL